MGLAVLPARLKDELAKVKECFIAGKEDISDDEQIAKHADWYKEIRAKYTDIKAEEVEDMLKLEVGKIFYGCITSCRCIQTQYTRYSCFQ